MTPIPFEVETMNKTDVNCEHDQGVCSDSDQDKVRKEMIAKYNKMPGGVTTCKSCGGDLMDTTGGVGTCILCARQYK